MKERNVYMLNGRYMNGDAVTGYRLGVLRVSVTDEECSKTLDCEIVKYIRVDRETMIYYVSKDLVCNCGVGIRNGKVYLFGVGCNISNLPVYPD